jgi:hypothetical protein
MEMSFTQLFDPSPSVSRRASGASLYQSAVERSTVPLSETSSISSYASCIETRLSSRRISATANLEQNHVPGHDAAAPQLETVDRPSPGLPRAVTDTSSAASTMSKAFTQAPSQTQRSWRNAQRWFRFFLFRNSFKLPYFRKHLSEPKKTAIYHRKSLFFLSMAAHLLPIGIGLSLAALNLKGLYIGRDLPGPVGGTNIKLLGLQLAAKLTELVAVASLADSVASLIRQELISQRGVPFAALPASLQIGSLSYLWSPELWALRRSNTLPPARRALLLLCLILCILVGALIGPSIAVLIQPRMDWWPAGGTDLWLNTTVDDLMPTIYDSTVVDPICNTSLGDSCPAYGWDTIQDWLSAARISDVDSVYPAHGHVIPTYSPIFTVRDTLLRPLIAPRGNVTDGEATPTWGIAAHPAPARALTIAAEMWLEACLEAGFSGDSRFWYLQDANYTMEAFAPYVVTHCSDATQYDVTSMPCVEFNHTIPLLSSTVVRLCNDETYESRLRDDLENSTQPRVHWIDSSYGDDTMSGAIPSHLSAAAIVTVPGSNSTAWVSGCSFGAGAFNEHIGKPRYVSGPTEIVPPYVGVRNQFDPLEIHLPRTLTAEWLDFLNPILPHAAENDTVFSQLAATAGAWNASDRSVMPLSSRFEMILMMMILNGMIRTGPYITIQGLVLPTWVEEMLPQTQQTFGSGGDAFDLTLDLKSTLLKVTAFTFIEGYAYSAGGSAGSLAAVSIVLSYCGFSIIFFILLWWLGGIQTSLAWTSATDLIALAFGSDRPSADFENTSAGIWTNATLRHHVSVRSRAGNLQLVAMTDVSQDCSELLPNVKY